MDFLSLFDPADGSQSKPRKRHKEQEAVKKKPEGTTKGRRRGRRANGKHETLPEESSFLNEPDLSTEILVKDGSYIDSYIEVNAHCDETKSEEQKVKKRASGRKSRRRKKISPGKEFAFEKIYTSNNNLNNYAARPKICDETIGKNVNDLKTDDYKARYRIPDFKNDAGDFKNDSGRFARDKTGFKNDGGDFKNDAGDFKSDGAEVRDRAVYNVIDKLEKVSLKDDMYLAGEFTAEDLESDFFYCSDEDDEDYLDEDTSDGSDSCGEVGGSLPPEPRFGNVEYKLRLSTHCERRFQHLVTQLKWRLVSGGGSCVYVVGVRDCGALVGLRARALRSSLRALAAMARALHARLAHVAARRVHAQRAVAEVIVKKMALPQQSVELRVCVMGANEAGKSTLIGVLTQGELDNGAGSARLNMFRHQHEVKSGMTSSLSHEILGFDAQGNVVNYGCSELMTAERIGERSAKLVSFLDLAGHSKYQRTTRHGLTGYRPHYAMLVISATAGVTAITEEHLGLLLALRLPFFVVLNKCELAPGHVAPLLRTLRHMLAAHGKRPVLITDEAAAREFCAPPAPPDAAEPDRRLGDKPEEAVAVFPVSCVRGFGVNSLHAHLLALQPPGGDCAAPEEDTCEFQVDEIFHVGDSGEPVVGGLLAKGQIFERDQLLIGPLEDGSFQLVRVRSIYRNRVPCGSARAGQPASLGLRTPCPHVRPGMVLLGVPAGYGGSRRRAWGQCTARDSTTCRTRRQLAAARDRSLLAHAHSALAKDPCIDTTRNIYATQHDDNAQGESGSRGDEEECICADRVLLEEPSDPRGCLFFQARVSVLRHATSIAAGFQCTVHVGNVRQTAIIEGIMSSGGSLRAGESAPALFRFVRTCEYLVRGRQLLFTAGLGTRGVGRITQIFPYVP